MIDDQHPEEALHDAGALGVHALDGVELHGTDPEAAREGRRGLAGGQPVFPLAILFGIALFESMERGASQVLIPEMRDAFNLTDTGILGVTLVALCAGLILTIPISFWADRGNRVRIMVAGAAVFAGFSVLTGIIPTHWWLLLLVRAGASIGLAVILSTHLSLLADWYDIPNRPRVYAVHGAREGLGLVLGFLLAGFVGHAFGWRVPFLIISVPSIVLVFVSLRLREPVRGQWERQATGLDHETAVLTETPPSFEEAHRMVQRVESLRRIFWSIPFLAISFIGFGVLANLFYERELHLAANERGVIEALSELGQLIGIACAATIGAKMAQRDPARVLRYVLWVTIVAAGFTAAFALAPNVAVAVLARIGIAAALAGILPSVFAALSLAIPPRARSAGFSIAVLYVLPGLPALLVVGWLSDHVGIRWGMLFMVPIAVIGGVIASTASSVLDRDIRNVWTASAARAELEEQRRQGRIGQLLVRHLDVRYGDVQVLFDVDFQADKGEIVALLGTNGAGKSTLLKAITGVVEASNGAVILDGRDVTHAPPNEIARLGVAMVPGGQGVFPSLTVSENLDVASWLNRRAARAGGDVDVSARIEHALTIFPILRQRLHDPAANLSGGQQQMLALGMAFVSEPDLLVIDELSLGLAPVIVEQLLDIVREINEQGTTVVLVEQSVNVALTLASRAYFMEKGEIRYEGPTAELLARPDIVRSVFLEGATKGLAATGDPASGNGHDGRDDHRSTEPRVAVVHEPEVGPVDERAGEPAVPAEPAIAVTDLSVRFGGIRAVDAVTFAVAPGEILGVIGPNGAGKTTLFDLISGFLTSDGGRVVLGTEDVSRKPADARARLGLGRSFQDARLFPNLTVEETIKVALERWVQVKDPFNAMLRLPAQVDAEFAVGQRVDELIALMGMERFRSKFVRELSTGSRRIVDMACVMAHRPSVVLLDEPSSGIAQRETEALGPLIRRIRDSLGAAVLVVEHDMGLVASVSDRLLALEQGHVVTSGPPDEVLRHPRVIESYLGTREDVVARSGRPPT